MAKVTNRHFIKENIQIANKYISKLSASLPIGKNQSQTTGVSFHSPEDEDF